MATFLLVPGAFHPAWIWHHIVRLLEANGHNATALDLPGTGENMSVPDSAITLALWADYVADQVRRAGGDVVLAGHSRGGHVIGEAAERVPDALAGLIYVKAVVSPPGMTMLDAIGREPDPGFEVTGDGRMDKLPEEVATAMFYHRCPPGDVKEALARLYREPWTPAGTPSGVSWQRWGRVPRAFIECTDDQALDMDCQKRMQARAPCDPVITLDADHSPFFCAPEALADAMIACAGQFAAARATA
jgi:pimeloyl-ACP methyl ester carboxylesterase